MDASLIYPASLAIVGLLAFVLYQNNSTKLMLVVLAIGGYIIYSHETGHTATEFKNRAVDSIEESADKFSDRYDTDMYDADKADKNIK
ncbi:MAG: hypothetical protein DRG24_08315 [Epsilonproteobacteria bacterium]|nr:MAG: hypothetical protein DRG24_08315 [Campylobacterota bacterium]